MNFEEIKEYWNSRAASDSTVQATTQDVYLRQIEATTLIRHISGLKGVHIGDFGCGDGRTTIQVAAQCSGRTFVGLGRQRCDQSTEPQLVSLFVHHRSRSPQYARL